jgi:hypothetical protein
VVGADPLADRDPVLAMVVRTAAAAADRAADLVLVAGEPSIGNLACLIEICGARSASTLSDPRRVFIRRFGLTETCRLKNFESRHIWQACPGPRIARPVRTEEPCPL